MLEFLKFLLRLIYTVALMLTTFSFFYIVNAIGFSAFDEHLITIQQQLMLAKISAITMAMFCIYWIQGGNKFIKTIFD